MGAGGPSMDARCSVRRLLVSACAVLVVGAAASSFAACTSEDAPPAAPDASLAEVEAPDAPAPPPVEAGVDAPGCSAVTGACDIVRQDCPNDPEGQPQECVVTRVGGVLRTRCAGVKPSQTLPKGRGCCPGEANPCLPGLTCVGAPCVDGGAPTGRCTPACCPGDDRACGRSDPEGIAGACDIGLLVDQTEAHNVCSYRERCKPFEQEPCAGDRLCLVEDKAGTAGCITSFGKKVGEECRFANECADGLMCQGASGDGGAGRCRIVCLTPYAVHPFDASVEEAGVYAGGCPRGEWCRVGPFVDRPAWLSLCTLDGG